MIRKQSYSNYKNFKASQSTNNCISLILYVHKTESNNGQISYMQKESELERKQWDKQHNEFYWYHIKHNISAKSPVLQMIDE